MSCETFVRQESDRYPETADLKDVVGYPRYAKDLFLLLELLYNCLDIALTTNLVIPCRSGP